MVVSDVENFLLSLQHSLITLIPVGATLLKQLGPHCCAPKPILDGIHSRCYALVHYPSGALGTDPLFHPAFWTSE